MKKAHKSILDYALGLLDCLYTLTSIAVGFLKSALSAAKELPIIGLAISVLIGAVDIIEIVRDKKLSLANKALKLGLEAFKLALATVSLLLPILFVSAALAIIAPIAGTLLVLIGTVSDIQGAISAYKKREGDAGNWKLALSNAVLGTLLLLTVAACFIPGSQMIAGPILMALIVAKLLLATYRLGRGAARAAQIEEAAPLEKEPAKELPEQKLVTRPTFTPALKGRPRTAKIVEERKAYIRRKYHLDRGGHTHEQNA